MKVKILLVLILILILAWGNPAVAATTDECYPGEHCYVWWEFESEEYCDGGVYTLRFCYLPADPDNREFHHVHATCDSSIVPPIIYMIALPVVMR